AQPISQIGDGQIQATTGTPAPKPSAQPISQIGDGQIQATTRTTTSCSSSSLPSKDAASQIGDGQVQATGKVAGNSRTTLSPSSSEGSSASLTTSAGAVQTAASDGVAGAQACKNNGTLQLKLEDGILHDIKGRVGSIVANRQFQFDGPPQAGAIYAAGWSITPQGNLALGEADVFYQCLSGNFYNLYDENIGEQCHPVYLEVLELVDC
ncbi:hypothetical protein ZYGR_0BB00100, partial [Zygosaccharomyces rouxii]